MAIRRVVAFIQARMGSSRLPGKILMDIQGQPMLGHVVSRLKLCRSLADVVVVTTTEKKDDPVEGFCRSAGIMFFRGSEQDVLDRYYQAALAFSAEAVVRITSDCPLIDPATTESVVQAYLKHADTACGAANIIARTYPRGLDTEVLSFAALEKMWRMATARHHREHVTAFMYEHPEGFPVISVKQDEDLSSLRWTVDETVDLELVREIYRIMSEQGKPVFGLNDIVQILSRFPHLKQMNAAVQQKAVL